MEHYEKELFERVIKGQEKLEHELKHGLERIDHEFEHVNRKLHEIEREINHPSTFNPATSVIITQIGFTPMLTISPGLAPQFSAILQPVTAGPFVASNILWSVSGDPGATVAQISTDPTGLTATLTLAAATVIGAILPLTVVVTNQDGTTVTATDTLTVVPAGTPPPPFVNATGVAVQQIA